MAESRWLLAEGGSTKVDWRLVSADAILPLPQTTGLNPQVLSDVQLNQLLENEGQPLLAHQPTHLRFYGPGLAHADARKRLHDALTRLFGLEDTMDVQHDLQAAVDATGTAERARVAILGTGSNAALAENGRILNTRGGEGYLIGDDGSGFDLGRRLLRMLLNNDVPNAVYEAFVDHTGQTPLAWRDQVMQHDRPNALIASLTPLVHQFRETPGVQIQIRQALQNFAQQVLAPLAESPKLPVYAIGSVAAHFSPELNSALAQAGLPSAHIIPRPIDALANQLHLRLRQART